ncbi:hypothetical protein FPQ18DRAFT_421783 [Pyronema domesticum]|nr:hypothetical protein FPQ18DRAFT_421783 [Pyronema domesticum]
MNDVLSSTSEYDKAGSSASISLLTLLPALLVLGPIPASKMSNLLVLSPMMGLITADLTLGIPVKSVSPAAMVIKVKDLSLDSPGGQGLIATDGLLFSSITASLRHQNQATNLASFHRCTFFVILQYGLLSLLHTFTRFQYGNFLWTCPELGGLVQFIWVGGSFLLATPIYSFISLQSKTVDNTYYSTPAPSWFKTNQCPCCSLSTHSPI